MAMTVQQRFVSIGCNRTPNASDWSRVSGRMAFGAHNTVALWEPAEASGTGIYATLKGHKGTVNTVKWIPGRTKGDEVIVTGGVDRSVRIWKEKDGEFTLSQTLLDHTGSVNCIAVLPGIIATGATDQTVNIYTLTDNNYTLQQKLQISPLYPLALSLHSIEDDFLLAIGGSSAHIHLYVSPTKIAFTSAAILKGHEDWIRGLAFTTSNSDILLATASQDRYVRLWNITKSTTQVQSDTDAMYPPPLANLYSLTASLGGESYPFTLNGEGYTVTFSALLPGHDDWVFTVSFHPMDPDILLSASADASLIIWRPEAQSGIWIPETRLGEVSSLKGATTAQGSSGGFWGGVWSPDGTCVASWGKTGGWRVWQDKGDGLWTQHSAAGGCILPVKGISWDPEGRYLLSVSLDQTTRLFGEWFHDRKKTWHEIARPQIHGYDLNTISTLPDYKFVSGADEKVLRVFQTSKSTANLIHRLAGTSTSTTENLPSSANLPVLGLSNKETSDTDEITSLDNLITPPLEDHLSRFTLSPELEKLYAHPSELIAIKTSYSGEYIASACKASTPENALIRIFNSSYTQIATLPGHNLTVTKITWTRDDSFLISVGRDRKWIIFDTKTWKPRKIMEKAHARIIWDVDIGPMELYVFCTVSRDKSLKIWTLEGECVYTLKFEEAVMACAFLPFVVFGMGIVAVGLENGAIYIVGCEDGHWRVLTCLDDRITHAEAVNGLAWRPGRDERVWELASCGDDCSVRIYEVEVGKDQVKA